MEMDYSEWNVFQKMSAVSSEVGKISKDATVGYGNNSYKAVTHDAVTGAVRSVMEKYGLIAITSTIGHSETREELQGKNGARTVFRSTVEVETEIINVDQPEDRHIVRSFGTGEDSGDKAVGKAISYATKYSLLKALMLETGEDTDYDASTSESRSYEQKPWLNDITELVSFAKHNGWNANTAITEARKKYAVSRKVQDEITKELGA